MKTNAKNINKLQEATKSLLMKQKSPWLNYANDRALLANKAAATPARRKSAGITATTKRVNTSAIIPHSETPVIKFVEDRSPVVL